MQRIGLVAVLAWILSLKGDLRPPQESEAGHPLVGSYVGKIYGGGDLEKAIELTIDSVYGNEVHGHDVVLASRRPFRGTVSEPEAYHNVFSYSLELRELGDNGEFFIEFYISAFDLTEVYGMGEWRTTDGTLHQMIDIKKQNTPSNAK